MLRYKRRAFSKLEDQAGGGVWDEGYKRTRWNAKRAFGVEMMQRPGSGMRAKHCCTVIGCRRSVIWQRTWMPEMLSTMAVQVLAIARMVSALEIRSLKTQGKSSECDGNA